jgi:ribosomal protein S18 acetylase RimI-like enzyme
LLADPASDLLASRVEDAGLNASAPPEQRWLDGWLLRFSPGKAKRARCINAVADGRLPLAHRLTLAEAAYREACLPLLLRLTPFTRPNGLEDQLVALGWQSLDDTRVMILSDLASGFDPRGVAPEPVTAQDYVEIVGALRGSPADQRSAHARRLLASPVPYQGFVVREGTRVLACAQIAREADLVGLYDVFTAPEARGQGLARRLCGWLLARAAEQGARHAYLQVEGDNDAARAVYRRLGFADAYSYHYRTPDTVA